VTKESGQATGCRVDREVPPYPLERRLAKTYPGRGVFEEPLKRVGQPRRVVRFDEKP
jgi:hypothetical protein